MANDSRIPGVEFTLESAEAKKVKGKLVGTVRLTAHINNLDMFDLVSEKLDGLKVYEADDFQTQVNTLLREDLDVAEDKLEQKELSLQAAKEGAAQQASFSVQQVEELRRENLALKRRVDQLEALERELQDLARS